MCNAAPGTSKLKRLGFPQEPCQLLDILMWANTAGRDCERFFNRSHHCHAVLPVLLRAKAAQDALTRSLALEFAPRGVRVNSVLPGLTQPLAFGA